MQRVFSRELLIVLPYDNFYKKRKRGNTSKMAHAMELVSAKFPIKSIVRLYIKNKKKLYIEKYKFK